MIQEDYHYYKGVDSVITEAIDFISRSVDVNTIFVAVNDSATNHVLRAFNRQAVLLSDGDQEPFKDVLCSLVVNNGKDALIIPDLAADPLTATHPVTCKYETGCFLGVPIRLGQRTVGTLCAFDLNPRLFTEHEVQLFRMFSLLLSQSINLENSLIRDDLTALYNRTFIKGFLNYYSDALHQLSVIYLDIDNFKSINDTFGHEFGDEVIRKASERLQSLVPTDHFAARLGGDEFVLLLPNLTENAEEHTEKIAKRIIRSFRDCPISVDEQELYLTVSAGISLYPKNGEDMETLLRQADLAMYEVKFTGKSGYQFFHCNIMEENSRNFKIRNDLRSALARQEFEIHYQPQINLKTGELVGTEALLRWRHPELGWISPAEFIPIAEEMGCIWEISEWTLFTACSQYAALLNQNVPAGTVSVNLSAVLFKNPQLATEIAAVLQQTGLPVANLHVEITETAIIQDEEQALRILTELQEMGVWVALDDFGTGYSSLSYLSKYPIDVLKIDRSLVTSAVNPMGGKVANGILALARSLGLFVVAEGIEEKEEYGFFQRAGCRFGQGYLFSKPLSLEQLETSIHSFIEHA